MEKHKVIYLWLNAEEENRKGNDEKCQELKDEFSSEFDKLNSDDKKYVENYLEDIAA